MTRAAAGSAGYERDKARPPVARLVALALSVLVTIGSAAAESALAQLPPDARWRSFETENFHVHFTESLDDLARRAADTAERSYALLAREFVPPPRGKIHLLVTNHMDVSNGFASPFPRNRIVVLAQPPASEATLAFHDDWLELLVLHELVHIFHLDHGGTVWIPLREVFGRHPVLFPQIFSPGWIMEGMGTFFESEYTGAGRVRGSMYDMILRAAILEDSFFEIDRATLDPVSWPGATTRYVYGSLFINHLARQHGPDRVGDFVGELGARLLPYRLDSAARAAFGTTFSRAWRNWQDSLRIVYTELADSLQQVGLTQPDILTTHGRIAYHPRFSPDGTQIAYTAGTGREETALALLTPGSPPDRLVPRSSVGPVAWMGDDELIHSQIDYSGPYRIYSDLHVVSTASRSDQITQDARIWEPDPHPDRASAIVVHNANGTNVLAVLDLSTGALVPITEPDLDVYWSAPRWSPDGERIAVSRWSTGGFFDVVVVDGDGRILRQLTHDRAVDSNPSWSPDGRYVLFSSDRTGIRNLFAYDLQEDRLRQVTNVLTGAFHPDVSPDGRWVAFSLYRSDGYHIARIPFAPSSWRDAPPPLPSLEPRAVEPLQKTQGSAGATHPYSAWPTVLPTSWSLIASIDDLGAQFGGGLSGEDVIERHLWSAEVTAYPSGPRIAGGAVYQYRGWGNPTLELDALQHWRVESENLPDTDPAVAEADLLRRQREASATLIWNRPTWRSRSYLQAGIDARDVDFLWSEGDSESRLTPLSYPLDLGALLGVGFSSVRQYELSLGPQDGILASLQLQARRYLDQPVNGATKQYWRATSRIGGYRGFDWLGFAPSVLATRVDAGIESEALAPGFSVGGVGYGQAGSTLDLRARTIGYAVRGYPAGAQHGDRFLRGSAEFRYPILLLERGFRLLPLALDRLWGSAFVDAGAAWCPGCPAREHFVSSSTTPEPLLSIGAEAVLQLRAAFAADLPIRFGVALPLRETRRYGVEGYIRVGAAF